jgi:hypothetical protein
MDEEKIYDAVEKGVRVPNHGYMCSSFKHCMTPKKRYLDPSYTPGALRKKKKIETPREEGEYPYTNVIPLDMVALGNVPYLSLTQDGWSEYFRPIENDPRFREILRWAEGLRLKNE